MVMIGRMDFSSTVFPREKHRRWSLGSYSCNGGLLTTRNGKILIEKLSNIVMGHRSLPLHT